MLREIYFRDPTDTKYVSGIQEISDELESLIGKLRMILLTNKGEVLGEPYFGMDLDKYLFETRINTGVIVSQFNAQVAKYIPEAASYQIDMSVGESSTLSGNQLQLNIKINNIPYLELQL